MKTLVIINGVTGAIGTACLAEFSRKQNLDIYGLSRKVLPFKQFLKKGKLPSNTLLCSLGDISDLNQCKDFVGKIDVTSYSKIIYIHAVGIYPFEINKEGKIEVANDADSDGIDDRVVKLSYDAFFSMVQAFETIKMPVHTLIFGGIADQFEPAAHQSWWRVMKKVKERMKKIIGENNNLSFSLLNISSVICPHEMLTRPFVFQKTNADPRFWLKPSEVAEKVCEITLERKERFEEEFLFHKSNYYEKDYFTNKKFTARKRKELGV